jgi:hypothetical protein
MLTFKVGDRCYVLMESGDLRKFVRVAGGKWRYKASNANVSDRDIRTTLKYRRAFLAHADDNIIEGNFND